MVEVLRFIFENFWHWLGTLLLVLGVSGVLGQFLLAIRGGRK